jgi:hypothetical protein
MKNIKRLDADYRMNLLQHDFLLPLPTIGTQCPPQHPAGQLAMMLTGN